jgi:glycosyltransferase involved in cell wall biosynthesis
MSDTSRSNDGPSGDDPRYAVVIATRNRGDKVAATLTSIFQSTDPAFEVIVVDQSTDDDTRRAVEPFLGDERLVYHHLTIAGTSHARNFGIAHTTAPYIVITDDDCIISPNWFPELTAPFEEHDRVGVVFCTVEPLPFDWSEGYTPHITFTENRLIERPREALRGIGRGLALGAGMAIRREFINEIGGFDETLGPGARFPSAEDKDVALRAIYRGWAVYENADTSVLHDGFRTMEEVRRLSARDFYGAGGTFGKYVRAGHWSMLKLIVTWLGLFGVAIPFRSVLHLERPRGFKRFFHLLRGVIDGVRTPVDSGTLTYVVPGSDDEVGDRNGRAAAPAVESRTGQLTVCVAVLTSQEANAHSGTAEMLMRHCRFLKNAGYRIEFVSPQNEDLFEMLDGLVDDVSVIKSTVGRQAFGQNFVGATKLFRRIKPDVVHFHVPSYRWGLDVVAAARVARVPTIIRTEQNPLMAPPEGPVRAVLRWTDRGVAGFVYNCVGNRRRFEELLPYRADRGHVLVNCIDPTDLDVVDDDPMTPESFREEFGFPADSRVAIFAAGFGLYDEDNRRPIYPVLDAFRRLLDDPDTRELAMTWRLLVLGTPQPVGDDRVYGVVEELGISDQVHFAGHRSDFVRVMDQCDLYLSAAHFEGSALTTFKGWALGVPILSTKVDGISDVIGEEEFERLMQDHGDIDGYAAAWYEHMKRSPDVLEVHRRAGETVLGEFTIAQMEERYAELYAQLIPASQQRA